MSNPNKARGTRWESTIRDYAITRGHRAFRPAQMGSGDIGDVHVDGLLCVQAKDHAQQRYSEWVRDAQEQAARAGIPFSAVVSKKRRASVGDAYAVMDLDTLLALVRRLSLAETFLSTDNHAGALYRSSVEREESK